MSLANLITARRTYLMKIQSRKITRYVPPQLWLTESDTLALALCATYWYYRARLRSFLAHDLRDLLRTSGRLYIMSQEHILNQCIVTYVTSCGSSCRELSGLLDSIPTKLTNAHKPDQVNQTNLAPLVQSTAKQYNFIQEYVTSLGKTDES